jgi:hypothetical protein
MRKLNTTLLLVLFFSSANALAEMDVMPGAQTPADNPASSPGLVSPAPALPVTTTAPSVVPVPPPLPDVVPETPIVNAQPPGFYYYCESLKAYYPTVGNCPESWVAIPVGAPPPSYRRRHYETTQVETPEEPSKTRPNAFTVDLFGRALLYSVNFDRQITDYFSLGVGISSWDASQRWTGFQSWVTVVPLYANFYFSPNASRGFLSAGADLIKVSEPGFSGNTFENSGVAGTVGAGYEFREQSGFLVRLAGYLIIGRSTELSPSVGLGIAF